MRSFLALLDHRKSIRIRIVGSFVLSFLIAFIGSAIITVNSFFDRLGSTLSAIASLLAFIAIFLLVFFMFTRRIVRYMQTLASGLMTIAKGNLKYRVPLSNQDELGVVAQNINYMAEQLHTMMDKERRLEMSKIELITHISHDLRTPLTSIIGYLNLLKNDDYRDLEEHKRFINNAFNKTQQLKKLIDDLFDYTRLTSGDVTLSFQRIDISSLVEQIVNEFEPIAQEHSLAVHKIGAPQALYVQIDVEKFVRALDNLLMNALKFSLKPGEVAIRLAERGEQVVLSIENRGKPITTEQEALLFERFYKAEPSRHDRDMPSGAGLGLSIASHIVELHGSKLKLHHQNGHFSFTIELPKVL
ncbi:two-component sensor histidine kinase [Paenibacillus rigui]|uniref:histidine kinase n=1 Tax=Paenibacillus rigui TaxID=554312 RepID=A0A229UJN2_9BACL|nr:two-component sensor histidine kinase [Paenibacillus rigui]